MAYPCRLSELEIILNKKADETSVIRALTIIHKDLLQKTKTKAYATQNLMEALLCKYRRSCKLPIIHLPVKVLQYTYSLYIYYFIKDKNEKILINFLLQNSQNAKIPNET